MKNTLLVVCLVAGSAAAQQKMMFVGTGGAAQNATFQFIAMDNEGGKVVTGAPYSAEMVSDNTQTLSDGTKISRKSSSDIYRDSAGRTRREMTLPAIGPWAAEGNQAPTIITITDPVAKEIYTLNTSSKTAQKMKMPEGGGMMMGGGAFGFATGGDFRKGSPSTVTATQDVKYFSSSAAPPLPPGEGAGVPAQAISIQRFEQRALINDNVQQESLGRQTMEGVVVDGTKTTHVIPEGQIGNDRPITSTTEVWYSADLQVTVMRKTVDPQIGENTYKLTGINRTEPDASLFQVPADYKVEEGMGEPVLMKRQFRPATPVK